MIFQKNEEQKKKKSRQKSRQNDFPEKRRTKKKKVGKKVGKSKTIKCSTKKKIGIFSAGEKNVDVLKCACYLILSNLKNQSIWISSPPHPKFQFFPCPFLTFLTPYCLFNTKSPPLFLGKNLMRSFVEKIEFFLICLLRSN